jgi:hypothetical protein
MGGFPLEVGDATDRGVGTGEAIMIGVALVTGDVEGASVNVSLSVGVVAGTALSVGSGVVSRGRTVAVGAGFGVDVGDAFGFAVGVGVSSEVAGVFARKGVEAASCARTSAAVTKSAIAKTSERMMSVSPGKIPAVDASLPLSARSRAIPRRATTEPRTPR